MSHAKPALSDVVTTPTPIQITARKFGRGRPPKKNVTTAVVFSDVHMGFEDKAGIEILYHIVDDVQPDILIGNGDLLDCYAISRFLKDPNRIYRLQDEINAARVILAQLTSIVPKSERILNEGNHEVRLTKILYGLEGPNKELARLTNVREAITWPALLGLTNFGWEWVPEAEQTRTTLLPNMIVKHGTVIRKSSGLTAKGEFDRYHRSGISGHTHRLGQVFYSDSNGTHTWIEGGSLCQNPPPYLADADWQSGFVVLTFDESSILPTSELVHIHNGRTLFRGKTYRG